MSVALDTATPWLKEIAGRATAHRLAAELGPRLARLVRSNFRKLGQNSKGWPSTNFWGRAIDATNWQEGFGFVLISINQIGVRQRLLGGDIAPVKAGALTIPAGPEAYGKTAREFNNLRFKFVLDPERNKMRPALVEAEATGVSFGKIRKDGTRAVKRGIETAMKVLFWLCRGVSQKANPKVLPSDEEFGVEMDRSVDVVLRRPVAAGN